MDAAGTASKPIALIPTFVFLFFLSFAAQAVAQTSDRALLERLRQLTAQQNWQEVIALVESARSASADLDFYYGTALAQQGRWEDAQRAFADGARLQPGDKRFPLELAGGIQAERMPSQPATCSELCVSTPPMLKATIFLVPSIFCRGTSRLH